MRIEAYKGVEAYRIEIAEKQLVQEYLKDNYKKKPENAIAEEEEGDESDD